MTRKRRGLSMTSILVLALVGTITAIVLGAMAVFLQTYQRSLIRSVQTSARQSVAQVGKTVEDYLDDAAKTAEEKLSAVIALRAPAIRTVRRVAFIEKTPEEREMKKKR